MLSYARMLTIRAANAADLPALAQLWHEKLILQADQHTLPAPDAREQWVEAARVWLDDPRCGIFAAERDGSLIGCVVGWVQPMIGVTPGQIGLITQIALDAHRYQGGVGRALVEALREWFAAQGAVGTAVCTAHFDAVTQAFWRSLGAAEWMDVLWIK